MLGRKPTFISETAITFLVSLLLFLALLPLSLKITFPQNDDWVYYRTVGNFMRGEFVLDPISAPTFYLQGILGGIFALVFGITRLPVLTLLVSCVNVFVFMLILRKFLNQNLFVTILLGALLFFSPLHIYSVWGFMTENYFLLFTTLFLFFAYKFEATEKPLNFILANVFLLGSFFIRQLAFVGFISLALYFFFQKKYRLCLIQLGFFLSTFLFYVFVFPKTLEMYEKPLEFKNLFELPYLYTLFYAIFLYIVAFTLPVLLFFAVNTLVGKSKKVLVGFAAVFLSLFFILPTYFQPSKLAWGEFYYLENTLERTGFYPRGIDGTKYIFRGIYDLYKYWDVASRVGVALLIASLIFIKKRDLRQLASLYVLVYIFVMFVTQLVYDRYLLVLIEVSILFFSPYIKHVSKLGVFVLMGFVAFLAFYSYQFSMDFIGLNSYVWNKSEEIHNSLSVLRGDIMATNSWKLLNKNPTHNYKYIFTYDSFITKPELRCCWTLVEEKKITFPLSLFIEPKIYLYKSK